MKFFEKSLRACIGAVAIYRFIIDPLPLALADEDLLMRSGDFITQPYSINFIKEYIGDNVVDKLKTTQAYIDIESWLLSNEKQNSTTFLLIHYQGFRRNEFSELTSQLHLCSFYDRVAVGLFMCSIKISQVFLEGAFWYWSDVKSNRAGSLVMGVSYYEDIFKNSSEDYNKPYDNVFLSRFTLLEKHHYVEHNEMLSNDEIIVINSLFEELTTLWQKSENELRDWLGSLDNK